MPSLLLHSSAARYVIAAGKITVRSAARGAVLANRPDILRTKYWY